MKRVSWLAVGVVVLLAGNAVQAQQPYVRPQTNPYGTPAISPYLNLARPGGAGLNYYNLVRPQVETNAALQQLETSQLQTAVLAQQALDPNRLMLDTGHSTKFMTYNQYFQNVGGQRPTAPAVTAPALAATASLNRGGR